MYIRINKVYNLFLININHIILFMQIQYLNINNYKYKIEYIPYEECKSNESMKKRFVMIRNFSLMNNIVADNNIYFIEKSIFNQYKENCLLNNLENKYLVFPSNKDTMYYSSEYHIYNDTYIDNDLISETGVYELLEKKQIEENTYTFENNPIICDLVKIYHPSIQSKHNMIIHIENVINNIHFHYICNQYQWYYDNNQYDSNDEFRYENNIYSEYIKCYIPNVIELFDRIIKDNGDYDYKWYYNENLNITDTVSEKNKDFINKTIIKTKSDGTIANNENEITNQYVPITLFTQSYILEEYYVDKNNNQINEDDEKLFKKLYFKYHFSLDNSYITTPVNVSLYPYISLNESTKIYTLSDTLLPGTASLLNPFKFTLSTLIDFNQIGDISLICYFDYPFKELFEKYYGNQSLTEAYCFYNHIINRQKIYQNIENIKKIYFEELDEINSITDIDEDTIEFLIKSNLAERNPLIYGQTKKEYYIEKLKESHWQVFLEDYIDEFKANIDFFGFRIEISSDKNFKNIILTENISILKDINIENVMNDTFNNDTYLDIFKLLSNGNFFFPVSGLFTSWKQMPDIVVARIIFIDRLIGQEIKSNDIFISKEKFKYITNVNNFKRVQQLVDLNTAYNNDMIELNFNNGEQDFNDILNQLDNNENNNNIKNQLLEWFNIHSKHQYSFINKINCIVDNKIDSPQYIQKKNSNNQNIIYKPIFFKTNKLNNVNIKYMQNQNIGIDLHEYISKVDLFIMTLGGNTYYEIGRNANYVLFNINATVITEENGTFEIYNNDHEYITYGTWSIFK